MSLINEFLENMESENLAYQGINNAKQTLTQLNDFKPIDQIEKSDIPKFINHLRKKHGYSEGTLRVRMAYIKKFFKYQDREDITKHLKTTKSNKCLDPSDILYETDINFLLENVSSPMYRALIIVLFETGARINEALAIDKDKDLIKMSDGYEVKLFSQKTAKKGIGYRRMLLIDSIPYINDWLIYHNKPSKKLFPMSDRAARAWLNNLEIRLKKEHPDFDKRLNPHSFRHGCASRLVREGVQESLIRTQLGWTLDSAMISTYVHLNDEAVMNAQRDKLNNGYEPAKKIEIIKPASSLIDQYQNQEIVIKELVESNKLLQQQLKMIETVLKTKVEFQKVEPGITRITIG